MARRRMFSMDVVDTDVFLEMSKTAQALYYNLGMRADDDGFIANPKRLLKMLGADDDDLKLLLAKGFLISFERGILVITHWRQNNYIAKDRYKETMFKKEKRLLGIDENNTYFLLQTECIQSCIQPVYKPVYNLDTQDSVGKDSIGEVRGVSVEENNIHTPTLEEIKNFCMSENLKYINPDKFYNHYTSTNWEGVRDWKAKARYWDCEDKKREKALVKKENSVLKPNGVFNNYSQKTYNEDECIEILRQKEEKQRNVNHDISAELMAKYPNIFSD